MKIRTIGIALVAILVVTAVIRILRVEKPVAVVKPESSPALMATPPNDVSDGIPVSSSNSTLLQKPGGPFEPRDSRWTWWNESMKQDPEFQWKMPILFYGKVLDEKGQPVQGAKFDIVGTDDSPSRNFRRTLFSDANGMISLSGLRGKGFGVLVSKDGYYTPQSDRRSFEYAAFFNPDYYKPDPNNPVIFLLRKKGNAQSLIHRQELRGFLPDGQPSYVDLVTGNKTRGSTDTGDLKITISRPTNAVKPYDWSVKLEALGPGSGVVESNEEFMFEAPEQGYEQTLEYHQSSSDPNWKNETTKRFYLRSRNGQLYARVEATIIPKYQDSAAIDWQYYVNDTGSRNLEPTSTAQQ